MPAIIPSDDTLWLPAISAGNNAWVDTDLNGKWRVCHKQNIVGEFDNPNDANIAAVEYIKAMHALKGI